jgi:5-methylcytosine-specific restriction endonuclease McrA
MKRRCRSKWVGIKLRTNGRFCHWCKHPLFQAKDYDPMAFPIDIPERLATADHHVPLGMGGTDTFDNVVVACGECNNQRGCTLGPPKSLRLGHVDRN